MCPPASSSGGSTARATWRSRVERRLVTGLQRPRREADQVGEYQRHLWIRRAVGKPPRSAPATPAARPRLTSREAASRSPSSRSAARAAARGPPSPAVDSGSPNSGSPGSSRRARRMNATTPGLRFGVLQPLRRAVHRRTCRESGGEADRRHRRGPFARARPDPDREARVPPGQGKSFRRRRAMTVARFVSQLASNVLITT